MKDFPSFVEIIDEFTVYYNLGKFIRKLIGIFLWLAVPKYGA